MSGEIFGAGAGETLASQYNTEFLGSVPMDANIRKGGDAGQPVVVAYPDSPAAEALRNIASQVAARVSVLTLGQSANFIPIEMVG